MAADLLELGGEILLQAFIRQDSLPGGEIVGDEPFLEVLGIEAGPILDASDIVRVFTVIHQLRVNGGDRISIEVDDIPTPKLEVLIVPMIAGEVPGLFVIEGSNQRGLFKIKLHEHAQPMAAGPRSEERRVGNERRYR